LRLSSGTKTAGEVEILHFKRTFSEAITFKPSRRYLTLNAVSKSSPEWETGIDSFAFPISCASALIQARMGKVVFGAYDKKRGGLGGSIDLSKHKSSHHKMEIVGGILEDECSQILQLWFKKLRSQK